MRSALKFDSVEFLGTFLKPRNIKLIILFEHQAIAKTIFIHLQHRKSSCDRFQLGLVLFSSPYRFYHPILKYRRVVKNFIRLYLRKSSCDWIDSRQTLFKQKKHIEKILLSFNFLANFNCFLWHTPRQLLLMGCRRGQR